MLRVSSKDPAESLLHVLTKPARIEPRFCWIRVSQSPGSASNTRTFEKSTRFASWDLYSKSVYDFNDPNETRTLYSSAKVSSPGTGSRFRDTCSGVAESNVPSRFLHWPSFVKSNVLRYFVHWAPHIRRIRGESGTSLRGKFRVAKQGGKQPSKLLRRH